MPVEECNENYLSPLLKKITSENKNIYLTGDSNINLLITETDEPTASFLNNMTSNLFIPHIILPTRITSRSKTLIDNIFSNRFDPSFISGNITTSISDHLPQFLLIPNINIKDLIPKKHNLFKRNTKNYITKEYYRCYFNDNYNNIKKTYEGVKSLISIHNNKSMSPVSLNPIKKNFNLIS